MPINEKLPYVRNISPPTFHVAKQILMLILVNANYGNFFYTLNEEIEIE